jgi:hypothetical protein
VKVGEIGWRWWVEERRKWVIGWRWWVEERRRWVR